MPSPSPATVQRLCRKRLALYLKNAGDLPCAFDEALAALTEILVENFLHAPTRFERWTNYHAYIPKRAEYVDEVIYYWLAENPRVQKLAAGETAAWNQLRTELLLAARRLTQRYQGRFSDADAQDAVQQASEQIDKARYPFDVAFSVWVNSILKNVIHRRFKTHRRRGEPYLSLDTSTVLISGGDAEPLGELLADARAARSFSQVEARIDLANLLARLGSRQRECIFLLYFEGLDADAAAAQLRVSKQNLFVIHSRALKRLAELAAAA